MKIALMNVNGGVGNRIIAGESNCGLHALEDALQQEGHQVELFPKKNLGEDYMHRLEATARDVVAFDPDYIGVSATSEGFARSVFFAQMVKKIKKIPIIAGGPHFRYDYCRAEPLVLNLVDLGDKDPCFDAVVVGQGKPFLEYIRDPDTLPEGMFMYKDDFLGHGKGAFPKITRAPFGIETLRDDKPFWNKGKTKRLVVTGNSRCPQQCNYCCIPNINVEITPEMIEQVIEETEDLSHITLADSNPFFYLRYYDEIFARIRSKAPHTPIAAFLDPSRLLQDDREKIYDMIVKYGIYGLFIGRETTSEATAAIMGRNYFGKPRTQKMLDDEHKAMFEFLDFLEQAQGKFGVMFAYIFSPWDSKETVMDNVEEMVALKRRSSDNVDVKLCTNTLKPWPGTQIRQQYIDKIARPNDYLSGTAYWWDGFPQFTTFSEVVDIFGTKCVQNLKDVQQLRDRARRIYR
jgi:hypothetical protein